MFLRKVINNVINNAINDVLFYRYLNMKLLIEMIWC